MLFLVEVYRAIRARVQEKLANSPPTHRTEINRVISYAKCPRNTNDYIAVNKATTLTDVLRDVSSQGQYSTGI